MELKHLQALLGVVDHGSFSAAAAAIGTVQSNVSAQVARLERELDVVLIDRSSGRPTEEGEVVASRARRMLVELDAMIADVVATRHEVRGTVHVGMIGTTGRWLVPHLFDRLRLKHPRVYMIVADGTSVTLEPRLVSGLLDIAVVTLPVPGDELSANPLFEEDLVLVVPVGDPLVAQARNEPLPLEMLASLDLILPAVGTTLRNEIDGAVGPAGIELHASMEVDGLRMIASLTFDGHGPAVLPATAVPVHLRDSFCLLPIGGMPRRRVGLAQRRRSLPSAPARAVIDALYAVVSEARELPEGLHPASPVSARARAAS
jgi:DNA-binding transcriptional LysR family regulator